MTETIYGGAIGDLLATPVITSSFLPPDQAFWSGHSLYIHPDAFYRAWGHSMWVRRLQGHPGYDWVAQGPQPARSLLDRLLPWRLR